MGKKGGRHRKGGRVTTKGTRPAHYRSHRADLEWAGDDRFDDEPGLPDFLTSVREALAHPHPLGLLEFDLDIDFTALRLDTLRRRVGGQQAFDTLDDRPLPDEPFNWGGLPEDVADRFSRRPATTTATPTPSAPPDVLVATERRASWSSLIESKRGVSTEG